jgi:hypothetical protein
LAFTRIQFEDNVTLLSRRHHDHGRAFLKEFWDRKIFIRRISLHGASWGVAFTLTLTLILILVTIFVGRIIIFKIWSERIYV